MCWSGVHTFGHITIYVFTVVYWLIFYSSCTSDACRVRAGARERARARERALVPVRFSSSVTHSAAARTEGSLLFGSRVYCATSRLEDTRVPSPRSRQKTDRLSCNSLEKVSLYLFIYFLIINRAPAVYSRARAFNHQPSSSFGDNKLFLCLILQRSKPAKSGLVCRHFSSSDYESSGYW